METTHTSTNLFDRIGPFDTVITLDMDGTLEDPWACCGQADRKGGSETCRHIRHDTLERVANLRAEFPTTKLVVLSWRAGMEQITRQWLAAVGIDVAAVFVPNGMDTRQLGASAAGQVGFKMGVLAALQAKGIEVLTGFDDNQQVVDAARAMGVPMLLVPRMVTVTPTEWAAGRMCNFQAQEA